jgi:hypothetical protein
MTDQSHGSRRTTSTLSALSQLAIGLWAFAAGLLIGVFLFS